MNCKTVLCWLSLFALMACGGKSAPYPPPQSMAQAEEQRQEFIQLFLQGHWCDARHMFETSQQNFLMRDDICAMALNCELALWVTSWAGTPQPNLADEAQRLRFLAGEECAPLHPGPLDAKLTKSLEKNDWQSVQKIIHHAPDALHASVFARKAAEQALQAKNLGLALDFVRQALATDRTQGWVVFLVLDWRLMARTASDPDEKQRADKRADLLSQLIQPCSPEF